MVSIKGIHHIAIICSNYQLSKNFYCNILGFSLAGEVYRKERDSWKADLHLNGQYTIELFSFPNPPARVSRPEATGLRHLAFAVENVEETIQSLASQGVGCEPIRVDEYTNKLFTFSADPDGLPIEFYQL